MTRDGETAIEEIIALAALLGAALRPEHAAEAAQSWAMMQAHRRRVAEADLGPEVEPAPLFRP